MTKLFKHIRWTNHLWLRFYSSSDYVQGQSPSPKVREYFYYIDHEGMLFLDDAKMKNFTSCFKDRKFLEFFFKRVKFNDTARYPEFKYVSLCGRELNYIRVEASDVPIVFTHVLPLKESDGIELLSANHTGDLLTYPFQPDKIYMAPSGRVYHPAQEKYGAIGLVRSKLAIEFSKFFDFRDEEAAGPTHFTWRGVTHELDCEWVKKTRRP